MADGFREENPFDAYRERVDRPLVRLFREYGSAEWPWFVAGVLSNLFGRAASLVPPVVLGAAIDGVFGGGDYDLLFLPDAWVPAGDAERFWFSAALIAGAFVAAALFTWIWGVTMNFFAHNVMHAVRVDTFEKMQSLDMTFFDDKQTGEVMSVLNNDASNLEVFLDNALSDAIRIA